MTTCDFSSFELFKQGAEARLSVGPFLGGKRAVLKERFAKKYRHPELDAKLTKDRFRGEVRSLVRCKTLPGIRTPTLYFVDPERQAFLWNKISKTQGESNSRAPKLKPNFFKKLKVPELFLNFHENKLKKFRYGTKLEMSNVLQFLNKNLYN